jgi:hypothetical protein
VKQGRALDRDRACPIDDRNIAAQVRQLARQVDGSIPARWNLKNDDVVRQFVVCGRDRFPQRPKATIVCTGDFDRNREGRVLKEETEAGENRYPGAGPEPTSDCISGHTEEFRKSRLRLRINSSPW